MRIRHLLLVPLLALPAVAMPQGTASPTGIERFDVAGLPKAAGSDLEREIFTLLRYHRRGDLRDATRIHLKLAEYYKERGENDRADDCVKLANRAWEAAESGVRTSAGTSGNPPFEIAQTFRKNFAYSDESLGVSHRWEFYEDGVLVRVDLDLVGKGYPSQRLVYGPQGDVVRIETDSDGDGRFVSATPASGGGR